VKPALTVRKAADYRLAYDTRCRKTGTPRLLAYIGTVSLRIVHGGNVQLARPELGIGDGHELVAALHQRRHDAGLALQHGIVGQVAERQAHQLVDEVRVA